ncbi:MAG: DUF1700 domain-containing protein [Lachnospiraceae bacterium]|nr:DUF1700 domain-containing protein [Lachnospiraceae bacterium]
MKKEEFLSKLRKNLSVLEEKEIQDIVEEYEQHIDMKMKNGLSEEEAIKDFGNLQELTAGILGAYHVKAGYSGDKKNIDFEKVKQGSRKATEKATSAIGKGAGTAGKWGARQAKKLYNLIKLPFSKFKAYMKKSRERAKGRHFWGRLCNLLFAVCAFGIKCVIWFLWVCWSGFCLALGIGASLAGLLWIFMLGMAIVLLFMGYPVIGITLICIGAGMVCAALVLLCFSLMRKKKNESGQEDSGSGDCDSDDGQRTIEEFGKREKDETKKEDFEYPKEEGLPLTKKIINSHQEVFHHA